MKEKLASCISIVLLAALVAGTWWAAGYARRAVMTDPPPRLTHEIDTYIDHFVLIRSDADGRPVQRLEGTRLEHYPDDDSSDITAPRAFQHTPGRPALQVASARGRMDQDGARILLDGDVRFRRNGEADRPALTVQSETMTLLPDEDVLFTDQPAVIDNGRSRIQGRGMRYDNVSRRLTVEERTQVRIAPGRPAPPARRPSQG